MSEPLAERRKRVADYVRGAICVIQQHIPGITQADIAGRIGVSPPVISEAVTHGVVSIRVVRRLASLGKLSAKDTIELLRAVTWSTQEPDGLLADLDARDLAMVIQAAEACRRQRTLEAVCCGCETGPGAPCKVGCPLRGDMRRGFGRGQN